MSLELQSHYQEIMSALCAEDLFGPPRGETLEERLSHLTLIHQRLARVVDPGRYLGALDEKEIAAEARERLDLFLDRARRKLEEGSYGHRAEARLHRGGVVVETGRRRYLLGEVLAEGDLSTVHDGECVDGDDFAAQVVVKIVEDPEDNDLAMNEVRILGLLGKRPSAQSKHFPVLLDHFRTTGNQVALVLRKVEGVDLYTVRESPLWRSGVDQKHALWMFNRLLSALGYAHSVGIIHGNLDPSHIMVRPRDHNLWLLDWSYALFDPLHTRDAYKVYNEEFGAPEIREGADPHPSVDLYSLGQIMIWLLGGSPGTKEIPGSVDGWLRNFILQFVFESPRGRPQDAWEMHSRLIRLRDRFWGQRFLEFRI